MMRIQADIPKVFVELEKLRAETNKINSKGRHSPIIITATATRVIVAIAKRYLELS